MVIPSWQADRELSSRSDSHSAVLANGRRCRTNSRIRLSRTFTSANSAPTKNPFTSTSSTAIAISKASCRCGMILPCVLIQDPQNHGRFTPADQWGWRIRVNTASRRYRPIASLQRSEFWPERRLDASRGLRQVPQPAIPQPPAQNRGCQKAANGLQSGQFVRFCPRLCLDFPLQIKGPAFMAKDLYAPRTQCLLTALALVAAAAITPDVARKRRDR